MTETAGTADDMIEVTMRDVTEWTVRLPLALASALTPEQITTNETVIAGMARAARNREHRSDGVKVERQPMRVEFVSARGLPGVGEAGPVAEPDRPTEGASSDRPSDCGHGHVWPNPSGSKARCGGPGICGPCSADEAARKRHQGAVPSERDA